MHIRHLQANSSSSQDSQRSLQHRRVASTFNHMNDLLSNCYYYYYNYDNFYKI